MMNELRKLYNNNLVTDPASVTEPEKYIWYKTDEGPVGLEKNALGDKEQNLLDLMFAPYVSAINLGGTERFWYDLLFRNQNPTSPEDEPVDPFRFLHFYVKDAGTDITAFSEALKALLPTETVVLWETKQQGVLVLPDVTTEEDPLVYEEIMDTIRGDFYTDLLLYAGPRQTTLNEAARQFRREQTCFQTCRQYYPEENIFRHEKQIPLFLVDHLSAPDKGVLFSDLLDNVEDRELLGSIHQYLLCNMNVTTAAKRLFIHRNSLQYRVDKFIEKTGIDVKQFPEAVTVYLALLQKRMDERLVL